MTRHSWQRLVIKVGTSTLVDPDGTIKYPVINRLAQTLTQLCQQSHEVILVTSGAIGVALAQTDRSERPATVPDQQAMAALGQSYLTSLYSQSFGFYHQLTGQVLLTYDVFNNPVMLGNTKNALEAMLAQKILPIINENDVIAVDELAHQHSFGDNDRLAAMLAVQIGADGLIILSDVDALYTANPSLDPSAEAIRRVTAITDTMREAAGGSISGLGTGGMTTKLDAAQIMLDNHRKMCLMAGDDPAQVIDVIAGEPIGTLFQEEL